MSKLRTLSLALALTAVLVAGFSTVGFSSVSGERGIATAVVDDESAYLGYETTDISDAEDGEITLVEVTNRFTERIEIGHTDVTVTGSDNVTIDASSEQQIGVGQSEAVTGELTGCEPNEEVTVQVTLEAEGTGVSAEVLGDVDTREFEVTCRGE